MTLMFLSSLASLAQESAGFSPSFRSTGFIGPLIVIAGAFAFFVALRRWRELAPERLAPVSLQRGLVGALRAGEVARGLSEAAASRTVLGAFVADGLALHGGGLDEMLAGVERAAAREALRLGNRVATLARLGVIVLLLGLLGATTATMSMLEAVGALKQPLVSDFVAGLQPAFTCVALGIFVALFCYVAFFWLDSCITRRTLAVRDAAEDLMHEAAERVRSG